MSHKYDLLWLTINWWVISMSHASDWLKFGRLMAYLQKISYFSLLWRHNRYDWLIWVIVMTNWCIPIKKLSKYYCHVMLSRKPVFCNFSTSRLTAVVVLPSHSWQWSLVSELTTVSILCPLNVVVKSYLMEKDFFWKWILTLIRKLKTSKIFFS